MNIRKITSMTMFVSFIFLVLTSVILYVVPHGRVAFWADWHLWGLTKGEWGNLHINLGFLFLLAGLLHMFYNWAPIKAYMKNKSKELKVFTPSFNVALILTLVVGFGTYFKVPPMSTVINFSESIKDGLSEKYGEPPYGHAELSSLRLFSKKQDLDLDKASKLLKEAGIKFKNSKDTIAQIATANNMSPQKVYNIIKTAGEISEDGAKVTFPDTPPSGFGKKTLGALCSEYDLMFQVIRQGLSKRGIKAEAAMTVKEIAAANDKNPMSVFEAILEVVNETKDH